MKLPLAGVSLKAQEMVGKMSISGVQPKLMQAFVNLPQNEELCMTIAEDIGIDVPAHCLVHLKDKSLAYVVKRFDRESLIPEGLAEAFDKLLMERFPRLELE